LEQAIWKDAWFVLRANRMDYARAPLSKPFGSPSKFNYHHQWLWDSGFHSIVWRWANDKHWAQEETANLFENQLEQGRISHEIYGSPWRRAQSWPGGSGYFAPTSQPPVLSMAAEKVFARTKDRAWLEGLYPRLMPYLNWWGTVRDPDGDGLAGWANGWESGLDDSPRWDHITRAGNAYYPAPLEAVELNALLVNEWRAVANLARLLGHEADAQQAEKTGARIKAAMRAKQWNEREGFFYCLDHEEKPIPIKTVGGLLGLLALEPGDPEVAPLVKHLTDEKEFWTPYPVPSTAVNEKTFTRGQMWRGPTWINTNWLLIRALDRLGHGDVASELKKRTLAMVVTEGIPKLWEWYDPISGKALGNMEYGWSTLVIDLMMDIV
jgi:glycogen debranching enzyme